MDFYERVKDLAKAKNHSLTLLVESCGIDYNTYKGCKRNGILPRGDVVVRLAKALETTAEYLVTGRHPYNRDVELLKNQIRSFLTQLL